MYLPYYTVTKTGSDEVCSCWCGNSFRSLVFSMGIDAYGNKKIIGGVPYLSKKGKNSIKRLSR